MVPQKPEGIIWTTQMLWLVLRAKSPTAARSMTPGEFDISNTRRIPAEIIRIPRINLISLRTAGQTAHKAVWPAACKYPKTKGIKSHKRFFKWNLLWDLLISRENFLQEGFFCNSDFSVRGPLRKANHLYLVQIVPYTISTRFCVWWKYISNRIENHDCQGVQIVSARIYNCFKSYYGGRYG